ncbi:MAG: hypothetical protein ACTSQP_02080 [Promethearchaeota archaeon]
MITWILAIILFVWVIYKRTRPDGKVEGYPLGMPRGTIRAIIALLIISFPFEYLINGKNVPSLITNAVFLIVAFYFEARKGSEDKLKNIVEEVLFPEKVAEKKATEKYPLYIPKYCVRLSLITALGLLVLINSYGPNIKFATTNTLEDLFLIIILFILGSLFRALINSREKKKIKHVISQMENFDQMSKTEVIENLIEKKESWWKRKWNSFISIVTLIAVITALIFYTINFDMLLFKLSFYELSIKGALLMLVSVYYGLRD